jgi:hypothetical protein
VLVWTIDTVTARATPEATATTAMSARTGWLRT